ncbi:FtsX-like permease family protein [Longispora albida]|uniref:FtsX-like permease family protein n=1 Tax=Longispora albida TaxID=203523 RepID=UPI000365D814|nr:ABC transporter permease [Longispora albida]
MGAICWATARRRAGSLVAVALAVLIGAFAVTATVSLGETGLRGQAPTGRLGGADVLIAAPQEVAQKEDIDVPLPARAPVPSTVVTQLAALPGVSRVVGDLTFPAVPIRDGAPVPAAEGHGWSSAALPATPAMTGRPPAATGELALDAASATRLGVHVGATLDVVTGGTRSTYRISSVLNGPPPGLYFSDAEAARLANRAGAVDLIAVWAAPGTSGETLAGRIRTALSGTDLRVATGDARGDLESVAAGTGRGTLIALSGSLAGVILMIAGFVLLSALGVHVAGQSRDLALIRAVGATPRQVRRLAAAQATLAAAVVLPFGIAGGYLLAGRAWDWFVGLGVIPAELPLVLSPFPALVTAALFLLVVQLAARGAAMRVSRLPATEAVAATATEPQSPSKVRAWTGLGLIVLATGMAAVPLVSRSLVAVAGTATAGIVAVIGLTVAGPVLLRATASWLARRAEHRSAPGWLALHNLAAYASRGSGALTGLAMAVTLAITYTFVQTTPQHGHDTELAASTRGALTVTAPGLGGVPAQALAQLRGVTGAKVAVRDQTTVLWPFKEQGKDRVDSYPVTVLGSDADGLVDLDVREGAMTGLTGDSIAVGASFARFQGLDVGGKHALIRADGSRVTATVAAIYGRELGYGDMVVSPGLSLARDQFAAVLVSGVDAAKARAALSGLPGIVVTEGTPKSGKVNPHVALNLVVVGALLAYVLLGVANSMVAATARRREEFAALRFAGATPPQLRAVARQEAMWSGLGACAAGLGLSALPLLFLGTGLLGTPIAPGPWWLVPAVCAVVLTVSYVSVTAAARRALRP